MIYDLSQTRLPDHLIALEAKYAEPMLAAIAIGRRMMELGVSARARLGVLSTETTNMFGKMDVTRPRIENPVSLSQYGSGFKLTEEKAVVAEFRRIFSGTLRFGLANAARAMGTGVYFVFYEDGVAIVAPNSKKPGRYRISAIRMDGASTMAEERACVEVNVTSEESYGVLWQTLTELARKEAAQDPTLTEDALDADRGRPETTWRRRALTDEEDEIDDDPGEGDEPGDADAPPEDRFGPPPTSGDAPDGRYDDDDDYDGNHVPF